MAQQKLRKYEMIYLVQPEATEEDRQKVADRLDAVIAEYGAHVLQREEWGKRKLAYEIRKQNKAYYMYLVFITRPDMITEAERVLRMLDNCVRWQTIKLEDGIHPDDLARYLPAEEEAPVEEAVDAADAVEAVEAEATEAAEENDNA